MKHIILILMSVATVLMTGCRMHERMIDTTTTKIANNDSTRDVRIEHVYDSIYIDRWHTIIERGDTVRVVDSVVMYQWRDVLHNDTLVKIQNDTIYTDRIIEKHVTDYVPRRTVYDRITSWGFWILIGILSLTVTLWILRNRKLLI